MDDVKDEAVVEVKVAVPVEGLAITVTSEHSDAPITEDSELLVGENITISCSYANVEAAQPMPDLKILSQFVYQDDTARTEIEVCPDCLFQWNAGKGDNQ